MDKNHAALILKSAVSFDNEIGTLFRHIRSLEDGEEKERIKKAVGDVMGIITRYIIFPLTTQHPDLDPDKKGAVVDQYKNFQEALNIVCGEINGAASMSRAVFDGDDLKTVQRELARLMEIIDSKILPLTKRT